MPTLDQISPSPARVGQTLSLQGSGFAAPMTVSFVGAGATATTATATVVSSTLASVAAPAIAAAGESVAVIVSVTVASVQSNTLALLIESMSITGEPAPMLCTLDQARAILRRESTDVIDDTRLALLCRMASGQIANEIGRPVLATSTTELYDGDGSNMLRLRRTPIVEVTALAIGGVSQDRTSLRVYPEFILWDEGDESTYDPRLRGSSQVFPAGRQNVSVTYRAGYTQIPAALADAALQQVVYLHNTLDKLGMVSQGNTQSGVTTTYAQGELCAAARRACARAKRVEVAAV